MSRRYRSTCSSAFTLMEAILTTALLAVVLVTVGSLSSRYANLLLFDSGKERTLNAMQVAVDRIRNEVREGVQLADPTGATPVGAIDFQRLDPDTMSARLPWPLPPPAGWDPADPADLVRIRYTVVGGDLVRQVTPPSGPTETEVLANGVTGLQAWIMPNQNLGLILRIDEGERFHDLTTEVFLPLR